MDDIKRYWALDDIAHGIGYHGMTKSQIKESQELYSKYVNARKKQKARVKKVSK